MVTWVIWLHQHEVFFKGRMTWMDGEVHTVEGFMSYWFREREGVGGGNQLGHGGSGWSI